MIYTTQGHQHGVGLEIFLKSIHLNNFKLENHILICFQESLEETLKTLDFKYSIKDDHLQLEQMKLLKHLVGINTN